MGGTITGVVVAGLLVFGTAATATADTGGAGGVGHAGKCHRLGARSADLQRELDHLRQRAQGDGRDAGELGATGRQRRIEQRIARAEHRLQSTCQA